MKWDIDKEIAKMEPASMPGTSFSRALLELDIMKREGVRPTAKQKERGLGWVWCLSIGQTHMAKAFFYGQTMRQAFLKAKKVIKARKGQLQGAWGTAISIPQPKRRK